MRTTIVYCMVTLVAAALSTSGSMSDPDSHDASKFSVEAEEFMHDSLALSPVNASQAGYHKHPDPQTGKLVELDAELDDLSPHGMDRQRDFYRNGQSRFRAFDPKKLDAEGAADWRLIDDQIALNLL